MNKKNCLIIFLMLLCVGALITFFLVSPSQQVAELHDGDPLRERGMRAAAIGGELAALAQGQLDVLPDEHRAEVGELLGELEAKVAAVKDILSRRDTDEENLAEKVAELEKVLEGILVIPDNEIGAQERRTDS